MSVLHKERWLYGGHLAGSSLRGFHTHTPRIPAVLIVPWCLLWHEKVLMNQSNSLVNSVSSQDS